MAYQYVDIRVDNVRFCWQKLAEAERNLGHVYVIEYYSFLLDIIIQPCHI